MKIVTFSENFDGARQSLQFLRGHELIETELAEAQSTIEDAANKEFRIGQLKNPSNRKPLLIAMILMLGQQYVLEFTEYYNYISYAYMFFFSGCLDAMQFYFLVFLSLKLLIHHWILLLKISF